MANMDSNQIANTLIQSMNSIADNAVKKSGFDKTIEAIIIECKDPTLGKYKVKYQDAIFFAYSTKTGLLFFQEFRCRTVDGDEIHSFWQ